MVVLYFSCNFFFFFLDRVEGREKDRERNINVWLPLTHPVLGTCSGTQSCALTGSRTSDPPFLRAAFNPLSHTSQGCILVVILMWSCEEASRVCLRRHLDWKLLNIFHCQ